ncbi:hypothetical protein DFH06DRAFT_1136828 [Mycena polygramma]|nr:hypothetical protein DFH06DRAFT_1136828 [Mycena polygramma]
MKLGASKARVMKLGEDLRKLDKQVSLSEATRATERLFSSIRREEEDRHGDPVRMLNQDLFQLGYGNEIMARSGVVWSGIHPRDARAPAVIRRRLTELSTVGGTELTLAPQKHQEFFHGILNLGLGSDWSMYSQKSVQSKCVEQEEMYRVKVLQFPDTKIRVMDTSGVVRKYSPSRIRANRRKNTKPEIPEANVELAVSTMALEFGYELSASVKNIPTIADFLKLIGVEKLNLGFQRRGSRLSVHIFWVFWVHAGCRPWLAQERNKSKSQLMVTQMSKKAQRDLFGSSYRSLRNEGCMNLKSNGEKYSVATCIPSPPARNVSEITAETHCACERETWVIPQSGAAYIQGIARYIQMSNLWEKSVSWDIIICEDLEPAPAEPEGSLARVLENLNEL